MGLFNIRVITAMRKAAVLPVPVWARPLASLPDRALGRISAWIGVQYWNPKSLMACMSGSGRSKSWKRVFPSAGETLNWEICQGESGAAAAGGDGGPAARPPLFALFPG